MSPSNAAVNQILAQKDALANDIAAYHYQRYSQAWSADKPAHFEKSVRDIAYHLDYLVEAINADQVELFEDYICWAKALFAGLHFPETVLPNTLKSMRHVLADALPAESQAVVSAMLDAGLAQCRTAPEQPDPHIWVGAPLSVLARAYIDALLTGDRQKASQLVLDAVENGVSVKSIYLDVFQQSQREIGRLWQINEISVAEEHYCTAATQLIMSQLYGYIFSIERNGYRMLATSVGEELHEIGIRMVADFFEMDGWDTYFMGANTPTNTILQTIADKQPHILAISATITSHIGGVRALIRRVREQWAQMPRIIVGGYPFNVAPDLWQKIGADGYGRNADEAIVISRELVGLN